MILSSAFADAVVFAILLPCAIVAKSNIDAAMVAAPAVRVTGCDKMSHGEGTKLSS
ncbi:MAG: hypothetical protein ACD_48C00041G0001 [uncultured bacterium]|nr:MAG: hypothetical protein ACD_48C00041G0001 [uncultured bacterium]